MAIAFFLTFFPTTSPSPALSPEVSGTLTGEQGQEVKLHAPGSSFSQCLSPWSPSPLGTVCPQNSSLPSIVRAERERCRGIGEGQHLKPQAMGAGLRGGLGSE